MYRYFKWISGVGIDIYTHFWKSEAFSEVMINSVTTSDHKLLRSWIIMVLKQE